MRCSWSSAAAFGLVACVSTTTTRIFVPSPQNPSYRPNQAAPVLSEYLRLQCPAFRQAKLPDTGTVRFSVDVDTAGVAQRAELRAGSGDKLMDDVFGTVAAQLTFPRDSVPRRAKQRVEPVLIHYQCRGDSASVVVR